MSNPVARLMEIVGVSCALLFGLNRDLGAKAGPPTGPLSAGQVRDDNGLQMNLVWCPSGAFMMGSPILEKDHDWDEAQVPVKLTKGFWLGKYEVTQAQWQRVMGTKPWHGKEQVKENDNCPATYVDKADALAFCRKWTDMERVGGRLPSGWRYTLPTEAQWEYACRAGTTTRFSFGDSDAQLGEYAWFNTNTFGERYPHEVGKKKPNPWGLYDIHGNVSEWCRDGRWDGNGNVIRGGGIDPEVRAIDANCLERGGYYDSDPRDCRSAARRGSGPGFLDGPPSPYFSLRSSRVGFRVVLEQGR
jgi:formylglycine-generating enzyme required for sulfatase activity